MNLALLGQQQRPQLNLLVVISAILPDIPIFVFYFFAKYIDRLPEKQIWSEAYYQPVWQNLIATFHSIPLALIGWAIARYYGKPIVELFCLSLLWHSLLDLPVHSEDAHRHFFLFSNYRFISPISYWDPKHHGKVVALVELLLVLVATVRVFPFVRSYVGKGLMVAVNLFYAIAYFSFYLRR